MTRFFCPGRVELAGNHTDHQRGRVMAAAMDMGITAEAEPNDEGVARVFCEGFDPIAVELDKLWPDEKLLGTSAALLRGAVGVFGLAAVAAVCVGPLLGLGLHYLLYKAAACVAEPFAEGRLAALLGNIGTAYGMALGLVGSAGAMLFISVVLGAEVMGG